MMGTASISTALNAQARSVAKYRGFVVIMEMREKLGKEVGQNLEG